MSWKYWKFSVFPGGMGILRNQNDLSVWLTKYSLLFLIDQIKTVLLMSPFILICQMRSHIFVCVKPNAPNIQHDMANKSAILHMQWEK